MKFMLRHTLVELAAPAVAPPCLRAQASNTQVTLMDRRSYLEEIWRSAAHTSGLGPGTVDLIICHDNSEHVLGRIGFECGCCLYEVWGTEVSSLLKRSWHTALPNKSPSNTRFHETQIFLRLPFEAVNIPLF
jgi:hypothetical protein